jgi:hypothetical protein
MQCNGKEMYTIPYNTISISIANANAYHTIPFQMHTIQCQDNAYNTIERQCIPFPMHVIPYHTIPLSMHTKEWQGNARKILNWIKIRKNVTYMDMVPPSSLSSSH